MSIPVCELTPEAFAPYGAVIEQPARDTDATGPGWNYWGELLQMKGGDRNYSIGYLDLDPAPRQFDWAERHMHTDELLVPLGGDCLVYVGPPEYPDQPERIHDLQRFEVFRVRQGQAVLLKPGVWHGAPLAVDRPLKVLVMLLHNTSKQDAYITRFEDRPLSIQA